MVDALTSKKMSPELLKVAERAKREPEGKFHSLAHLLTEESLERAFHRQRNNAAVGVDGVTKEQYGQGLPANLKGLLARMKAKQYRHQPVRRVHIPKEKGKTRPIGISTVEDKIVQGALREVLEAIYEQDFLSCSHGFRPGRSAHDAIRALDRMAQEGETNWLLEADVTEFFPSIDRAMLMEMLQHRVADGSLLRLIGKCLHVGVLDGEEYTTPEEGTAQGSVISPMLGNIYLHYVLDRWFENEVKPRLRGKATLVRYADDFVIGLENREDAERVMAVLHQRMKKYRLSLHPDKTRLLAFGRPSNGTTGHGGSATFDFLGFTHYWRRTLGGKWAVACKTRRGRLGRAIKAVYDWSSASGSEGATRSPREPHRGTLQLLRCERQHAGPRQPGPLGPQGVAQVVESAQPEIADDVGAVSEPAEEFSAPRASRESSHLAPRVPQDVTTEEPDGGNLLVRIWRGPRGSQRPGLPYRRRRDAPSAADATSSASSSVGR
jgi:RNA-directed DNA polymerase